MFRRDDNSRPGEHAGHILRALVYLQACSLRNKTLARLRRLKQPKYLLGALVGGAYFYFYFFRYLFVRPTPLGNVAAPAVAADFAPLVETLGAVALFGMVLLAWLLPRKRAALAFSEAEVAFLFPAPISRRTLIHFKLLRAQSGILFTAVIFSVFSNRFGQLGRFWLHAVGWWLALATLNLHFLGASFTITRLFDAGVTTRVRRWAILLGVAGLVGGLFFWARNTVPAPTPQDFASAKAIARYLHQLFEAGPAPWLLHPFRLLVRPYLATDGAGFLQAIWPVLLLILLHYVWVIRSAVAFEEASLELSRKRAEIVSAAREGRDWRAATAGRKAKRSPFRLAATGAPSVALLWKNLIASGRVFNLRVFLIVAVTLAVVGMSTNLGAPKGRASWMAAGGMFSAMVLLWSLLIGPHILRQDLRHDLPAADVLKQYPLRGWQVVLGELLAPTVILVTVQWLLLVLLGCLFTSMPGGAGAIGFADRIAVGVSAALLLPGLDLILLLIPNAAMLLWPGWMTAERGGHGGIEVMGQRIILVVGQLLVFVVAVSPAAVALTVVLLGLKVFLPWPIALLAGTLVATVLLLVETVVGIHLLGRLFERFDLSAEA